MLKQFAIILLCLTQISPNCLEGCLRCSPDYKCLYCDVTQQYYLTNDRCLKSTLTNCLLQNEKNNCLICKENFYLDKFTNACIELIPQLSVENCSYHASPNSCKVCSKGFYALRGNCININSPIGNCDVENSRGECERCASGFVRSIDRRSCQAKPSLLGCATFANVQCRECGEGYIANDNLYLQQMYSFRNSEDVSSLTSYRNDLS